ncbi:MULTISPECIES: helix-turn-helix transcriptional regulator [Massilia]|uniref:helix-turn-helix transcriptional regulator n=1 Tax=Massilia TaxID=149698 RepID=UPI000F2DD8AB|nr:MULTISPECIES: LuxR C-terminal-related transcriptional regulator [Massilia]MDY0961923.1 LuxR C-terminal-related transcriptional regulator [Massilia sp. CFBP9026]
MKYLSDGDVADWLSALRSPLAQPDTIAQWIDGPVKKFFPYERMIIAHGVVIADQLTITDIFQIGHSQEYLSQLQRKFDVSTRGSLKRWMKNRMPFFIDPEQSCDFVSALELDEIQRFDLKNIAGHGTLDLHSSSGTYVSFCGVRPPLSQWHLDALSIIVPQLTEIYLRQSGIQGRSGNHLVLTVREKSIVRLLVEGTDSKTIGRKLDISEKTVRNQLTALYAKAGVSNRVQLVARLRKSISIEDDFGKNPRGS